MLLGAEKRQQLEADLEQLAESLQRAVPRYLATAVRLASDGVYSEALEFVDTTLDHSDSAAIHLLGALFAEELGFLGDAAGRYSQARHKAKGEESSLIESESLMGLARIEPDHKRAREFYQAALDLRKILGDAEAVASIREAIAALP